MKWNISFYILKNKSKFEIKYFAQTLDYFSLGHDIYKINGTRCLIFGLDVVLNFKSRFSLDTRLNNLEL